MTRPLRPAVFLDRDGVLNPDSGYPHRVEQAEPYAEVGPALARLQRSGFELVVVSNQSGVGRRYYARDDVDRFNAELAARLGREAVRIGADRFYCCPHTPDDRCACRKPQPGMILDAARDHGLDLGRSFMVGDRESDVEAGKRAGLVTILVDRRGERAETAAEHRVRDVAAAADVVLERSGTDNGPAD